MGGYEDDLMMSPKSPFARPRAGFRVPSIQSNLSATGRTGPPYNHPSRRGVRNGQAFDPMMPDHGRRPPATQGFGFGGYGDMYGPPSEWGGSEMGRRGRGGFRGSI